MDTRRSEATQVASAPDDGYVVLTVQLIDDGEVSPYLVQELRVGDQLELRGPIGGYFVWTPSLSSPVQLFAGGSGIVPFRAMLRHHTASHSPAAIRLLYSARRLADVFYREEFARLSAYDEIDIRYTLTREWPERWRGYRRRIDRAMVNDVAWPPEDRPLVYVCGPSSFVETVADDMVALGHDQARIKTERFGASGGAR